MHAYHLSAKFVSNNRVYQASGYTTPGGRIIVTGIKVHFQQVDRDGFKRNRTRYVFRGMESNPLSKRGIIPVALQALRKSIGGSEASA